MKIKGKFYDNIEALALLVYLWEISNETSLLF